MLKKVLDNESQEDPLAEFDDQHIPTNVVHNNMPIEIDPGKVLNINGSLNRNNNKSLLRFYRNIREHLLGTNQT